MLIKWQCMPNFMKNKDVKTYYDILKKRQLALLLKRILDICLSLFGLIVALPVMIILAIAIKLDSKGPVFYRQERVTTYGKKFKIFKFRTMVSNADKIGSLVTVKNDNRITKVGKFIRKCRLDEFPQLINILIGDMTFVGTRPEVQKYVDCYTNEMKASLLMKAGVTSMTSILFKDEDILMEKYSKEEKDIDKIYVKKILPLKMKYNLDYVKKFGILSDIKIIFLTVLAVLGIKRFDGENA